MKLRLPGATAQTMGLLKGRFNMREIRIIQGRSSSLRAQLSCRYWRRRSCESSLKVIVLWKRMKVKTNTIHTYQAATVKKGMERKRVCWKSRRMTLRILSKE
jgi:hypothetical protein